MAENKSIIFFVHLLFILFCCLMILLISSGNHDFISLKLINLMIIWNKYWLLSLNHVIYQFQGWILN